MGMSTGGQGKAVSDINVTPLVDVMLVLLIIFMVTQPLIQNGIDINLPNADAAQAETRESGMAIIITKDQKVLLGKADDIANAKEIVGSVEDTLSSNPSIKQLQTEGIYLWADGSVPYERVVQVMAAIQKAGVTKMGIITDPLEAAGGSAPAGP